MLPDVIDEFMIETGDRKEAIFYSFYVFFTKFSSGISVAGSSLLLEYEYLHKHVLLENITNPKYFTDIQVIRTVQTAVVFNLKASNQH